MMRKHDYVLLAKILRPEVTVLRLARDGTGPEDRLKELIAGLCIVLQRDNVRFDKTRFKGACGL